MVIDCNNKTRNQFIIVVVVAFIMIVALLIATFQGGLFNFLQPTNQPQSYEKHPHFEIAVNSVMEGTVVRVHLTNLELGQLYTLFIDTQLFHSYNGTATDNYLYVDTVDRDTNNDNYLTLILFKNEQIVDIYILQIVEPSTVICKGGI